MRTLRFVLGFVAAVCSQSLGASATTLNFDNLTTPLSAVPTPYSGFTFTNFFVNTLSNEKPSGYVNGTVSGSSVIYNGFGQAASLSTADSSAFTLNDFYLTAAINDGLEVDVIGSLGGVTLYTAKFNVSTGAPTRELLDWVGIDTISFVSSGGTLDPIAGLSYVAGSQFVLDNVRFAEPLTPVASTPEPGTLSLLSAGMLGLATMRRRFSACSAPGTDAGAEASDATELSV